MRSEQAMFDLILSTARRDERIRAVIMNGSRANPNAPRDCFQDYDIVYIVSEVASFKADPAWINCFGERMILQLPDDMGASALIEQPGYAYLIQLMDGNRIDLTLFPLACLAELGQDSESILLLDKDGVIPPFAPASDCDYLPKPPTAKDFFDCCNEFWWVSPYVAKGLWRRELPYAKMNLDHYLREQLMKMLVWYVGSQTQFSVSTGKAGKYLERCLAPELWQQFLQTYSGGSYDATWEALFAMCDLFRLTARAVAQHFGFEYRQEDDDKVSAHLRHVRALPQDAREIY